MCKVTHIQVLKLYKDLLRYGQDLKLTDSKYFCNRIRKEFKNNKALTDQTEINHNFEFLFIMLLDFVLERDHTTVKTNCAIMLFVCKRLTSRLPNYFHISVRLKHEVDYSRVPTLCEKDLEEMHVRGSGPGGQKTNKTSNCVVLKHLPTGIVVKCHETRYLEQNQKLARATLLTKLDNLINGDQSIEAQLKAIEQRKSISVNAKRNKLRALKEEWKKRENLTE